MQQLIVLLVSLVFDAVGFISYVFFFSIGYGLAIAAIAVTMAIMHWSHVGVAEAAMLLTLFVYGMRLASHLILRELRSTTYHKVVDQKGSNGERIPALSKVALWAACSVLYVLQTSPVFFRLANGAAPDAMLTVGTVLAVIGFALEAAADTQKAIAKKRDPYTYVSSGLYAFVRCPNYLGELIVWFGVFLSGVTALRGPLQWLEAIAGLLLIVYVMFSGARRLEIRQDRNYGKSKAYRTYVRTVPILLPFVPLYSVKRYTFLMA
jgi:steroid 5-alpha reductase family enzyme